MSDQDLEKVDSGRRDFLKKSIVAGAVVWGAPAVTSLPGGKAWAQSYNDCLCTADAYGLRVIIPIIGFDQTFGVDGSLVNVSPIAIPVVGGSVAATAVTGTDSSSAGGACAANASIATLNLQVGPTLAPILTVGAAVITSQASATCPTPTCATSGSSLIANLTVNGIVINATSACNNDVLNLGLVVINEQTCDAEGNLTVNAIHVTVPGIIEVIAAHSVAGAGSPGGSNCPCVACA